MLALSDSKKDNARVVVTGCMAERYGSELADALPEVDLVAGFGVPVTLGDASPTRDAVPSFDLLNLPRPKSDAPWAYVKVAEGCDRNCGFCAIPSFRGKQRSRTLESILDEVDALEAQEIVLVAQDLASYGNDIDQRRAIIGLVRELTQRVARVRSALPLPVGPQRRAHRHDRRNGRAVLRSLAPACVGAAPAAHAPVGQRRQVPRPHRRHPHSFSRRDAPLELHRRATRARPRPITTRCSPSCATRSSTGPVCSPSPVRRARTPMTQDGHVAADADRRAPGRGQRAAGHHHADAAAPHSSATRSRCSSTARGSPAAIARHPRSTASCECRTTSPSARSNGRRDRRSRRRPRS